MRKIGMNLRGSLLRLPEECTRYIKAMADAGFSVTFSGMVEMHRQVEIADELHKYGMAYETLHAPSARINSMWLPGEEGDDKLKELLGHTPLQVCFGALLGLVMALLMSL